MVSKEELVMIPEEDLAIRWIEVETCPDCPFNAYVLNVAFVTLPNFQKMRKKQLIEMAERAKEKWHKSHKEVDGELDMTHSLYHAIQLAQNGELG